MMYLHLLQQIQMKCAENGIPTNVTYYDETFFNMFTIVDGKTSVSIYSAEPECDAKIAELIKTGGVK